jgi:putative PIN family toxin of toxin-antitoxin system
MIVVLDSNVIISAANFGSPRSAPVLALEKAVGSDLIATCDDIDAELIRILLDKFEWSFPRIQHELLRIHRHSVRVTLYGTVHLCRDPDDNKILECAERARADLIVTGDKDLLSLRTHGQTRIVTPAAYLRL